MTTNLKIIDDALRLIGVIGEAQQSTAEQGDLALRELNQLMENWAVDGVVLGYFAQSLTADTCPIPAWAERGVKSRLAQSLLSYYPSSQQFPFLFDDDLNGVNSIRRNCIYQTLEPLDLSHLGRGAGHDGAVYDITD